MKDAEVSLKESNVYDWVTCTDEKDDPIAPQVDLAAKFGDDTIAEIKLALAYCVAQGNQNELSVCGAERLRLILKNICGVIRHQTMD